MPCKAPQGCLSLSHISPKLLVVDAVLSQTRLRKLEKLNVRWPYALIRCVLNRVMQRVHPVLNRCAQQLFDHLRRLPSVRHQVLRSYLTRRGANRVELWYLFLSLLALLRVAYYHELHQLLALHVLLVALDPSSILQIPSV